MPADVVVLWQEATEGKEAAGGKVWSLKRTWQQQENWATTREQGSNKAEIIGREPSHSEMWKQTHLRKGSRPLIKILIVAVR
ncbi:hypothetical protein Hdeb2414_s0003g00092491 [Helianthus debilis subsp. tardiflorus]